MRKYEDILKMKLTIERYTGPGHTLEINLQSGEVFWTDDLLFYQKPKAVKRLTTSETDDLRRVLETASVLNWQSRYYDLRKLDGDLWSLTLFFEEDFIKFRGTGVTPEAFERLTTALSELSGRELGNVC